MPGAIAAYATVLCCCRYSCYCGRPSMPKISVVLIFEKFLVLELHLVHQTCRRVAVAAFK